MSKVSEVAGELIMQRHRSVSFRQRPKRWATVFNHREAVDPTLPPQRLLYLHRYVAEIDDLIAGNPNVPLSLLWKLALDYPEAVLANPILPLLFLEDPNLAHQLSMDVVEVLAASPNCPRLIRRRFLGMTVKEFQQLLGCWATTYDSSSRIANALNAALERYGRPSLLHRFDWKYVVRSTLASFTTMGPEEKKAVERARDVLRRLEQEE